MASMKSALAACVSVAALVGCQMDQAHERELVVSADAMTVFLDDKPAEAKRLYRRVLLEGERNVVLNQSRAGLAAMWLGAKQAAEQSFDQSLSRIEAIYANTEEAEKARSVYYKENIKVFKGEPYERAMAYYYRGLLYLMAGDFDNARASFKGGMLQDGLAEDERYRQDFAVLAFLEGWTYHCQAMTTQASERFAEAAEVSSLKTLRAPEADHRYLLIAETGAGPRKVGGGEFKHLLQFEQPPSDGIVGAEFRIGQQTVRTVAAEDIYWQATTRGGRQIDAILNNKAVWKGDLDKVGDVMMTAGTTTMMMGGMGGNDSAAMVGGLMMLMGAVAKANSAAMNPAADIRQWDNLPGTVHIATTVLPAPGTETYVNYLGADGTPTRSDPIYVPMTYPGQCGIAWARSLSPLEVSDSAPGAVSATGNRVASQ